MRPLVALLTATVLLAPVSASPSSAARPTGPPSTALRWGSCPSPAAPAELRCATLRVPTDYSRPHGRQTTLTISRLPAGNPQLRRGVLITNPGGPGQAGLLLPAALAHQLPPQLLDRYDLIGFDPRGVGHSTPVTCGGSALPSDDLIYPYPGPDGSIARNVAYARTTAAACARHGGPQMPHVTTANTARDMDRIRAALGERRISYLGWSYGTYLGAVYRQLFGNRVDRMVLDSAIDPARVWYDQYRTMSRAADRRLDDLTAWAAARHADLGLGATPAAVRRRYLRVAAGLDREPVTRADGVVVTGAVVRAETFRALYHDDWLPTVRQWLDPSALPPAPPETVDPAVPADNATAALYGVVCGDVTWPRDVRRYRDAVRDDRRRWPATDGMPANIWPCAFWHRPPVEPAVRVTPGGPRNTLIVQNLRDPASPSTGGMRRALGPGAVQITVDAGGHGVLGNGSCADRHAVVFLTDGLLPAHDQRC
ncbi:alpha/beta hydrolase [Actinoplanes sp. NPDC049548]|uniref:alpha/beta hydrolase n=1 Tax=Actinoplanes sp. NPDC049548 TaxID=3155152 RepID=UPI0034363C89